MLYTLKVQNEAIVEMQEAYDWYEKKRRGLGDELIEEIEDCFAKITANPQFYSFSSSKGGFRRIKVERFPYMVVYEIEETFVFVISVRNTWMRPKY
jgi:plasmid stabilization system protein ParE